MRILILILFLVLNTLSYSNTKSNYEIIDSIAKDISIELQDVLKQNNAKDIFISKQASAFDNTLISNYIILNDNYTFFRKEKEHTLNLGLDIRQISVNYSSIDEEKILRIIDIDVICNLSESDKFIYQKEFNHVYSDTISIDDLEIIENKKLLYTVGEKPEKKVSTYSSIIEPIIVIGSAVATIALFFTVRSK